MESLETRLSLPGIGDEARQRINVMVIHARAASMSAWRCGQIVSASTCPLWVLVVDSLRTFAL